MVANDQTDVGQQKQGNSVLILAIDTSGQNVSVALLEDDQTLLELGSADAHPENPLQSSAVAGSGDRLPAGYTQKSSKRGSKTKRFFPPGASELLAPLLKSLMDQSGFVFKNIDLIALTVGPGLFTGLRVGVVTAKALAYSTNASLIGVNSLEVTAARAAVELDCFGKGISSVVNAQRQQLFCGFYASPKAWELIELGANAILSREDWLNGLSTDQVVTGSGLKPISERLRQRSDVTVVDEQFWDCSAPSVGKYAFAQYQLGKRDDFWKLEPVYFRPSAAEEVKASNLGS